MLKSVSFIPTLVRVFLSWLDVEFYQMFSSAFIEIIMWFLSFLLFMWCITLIDLCMLDHPCDYGMNPTWSWCMIFYWIWLANILLRIFASIFIKDTGPWFSLLVVSLSAFGINQRDGGFIEWLWECSFLFSLLEESEKDLYELFIYFVVNLWSHLILDFCVQRVWVLFFF